MTAEIQNNLKKKNRPLLANGSLTHGSLGNAFVATELAHVLHNNE
jgi:hypothetical protein